MAPASSTRGDVGVIHQRQGLPLRLEAGDDLRRIHARLDDFQGHLAADRFFLLGHIDDAKAPLADLLQQLVGADDAADILGRQVAENRCDRLRSAETRVVDRTLTDACESK